METMMAGKKTQTSPLLQQHLRELAEKDFDAGMPERPAPPQRPAKIRKPMSGPISGIIFVDGQPVGPTPAEWAKPKQPALAATQAAPLSDAEIVAERKARKAQELAERMQRWNRPDRRPQRPPPKPLSPATAAHFLKQLERSEI
jgi:hypothetical protein